MFIWLYTDTIVDNTFHFIDEDNLVHFFIMKGRLLIWLYVLFQKPETWEQLKKKYDPTGEFSHKYEDELEKHNIKAWII